MRRARALALIAVAGVSVMMLPTTSAQEADTVRVIHLVIDGLHPDQVGPTNTPNLQALRDSSVWYEQHRAVMAAETLPNHVAMATGTYPARNGIPNNEGRASVGDQDRAEPDLRVPAYRMADSFVTAIERVCSDLRTVTAFSKAYVHGTFAEDGADSDFPQPEFNIPVSDHALDVTVVSFLLSELGQAAPDYLFANLGDVDRAGHTDPSGWTGTPGFMLTAITHTDTLVGLLVETLKAQGLWEETVLVINSDHSMDWSVPGDASASLDLPGFLDAEPATAGRFFSVTQGGMGQFYLLDPAAPDADAVLKAARETLGAVPGVREAMYREPNPLDPGWDMESLHPDWNALTHRIGEVFVVVESGFRPGPFASADSAVPGYHGHGETRHATMMITGGWDGLAPPTSIAASNPSAVDPYDDTAALPEQSEQVDLAPTFGWLLGVPDPGVSAGGSPQWQGRVLSEAFARQPAPACVAGADDADPAGEPDAHVAPSQPTPATGGQTPLPWLALLLLAVLLARGGRSVLPSPDRFR